MLIFKLRSRKSIVYIKIIFTFVQRMRQNDIWTALQQDLVWTVSLLKKNILKPHASGAFLLLYR